MQGAEKRVLRSEVWRVLTQRTILPWVLRFDDLPKVADALEVGAGAGFNAEKLLATFPSWSLTVTDLDEDLLGGARERLARFGDRATIETVDATKLPYDDDTFDVVVSLGVWHHVGEWERALAECARVLRSGARLVLVDLLAGFFKGPIAKRFPPERTYSIPELRDAIAAAGFARWRLRAAGSLWYRLVAETPP